jgi:hypothetical protein
MSALRTPGSRFFEIPKSEIQLGSLPAFEYGILRLALEYAVRYSVHRGNDLKDSKDQKLIEYRKRVLDQASEFRALQRRFLKAGRRSLT